jgi:hypothetical protein
MLPFEQISSQRTWDRTCRSCLVRHRRLCCMTKWCGWVKNLISWLWSGFKNDWRKTTTLASLLRVNWVKWIIIEAWLVYNIGKVNFFKKGAGDSEITIIKKGQTLLLSIYFLYVSYELISKTDRQITNLDSFMIDFSLNSNDKIIHLSLELPNDIFYFTFSSKLGVLASEWIWSWQIKKIQGVVIPRNILLSFVNVGRIYLLLIRM